MFDAVLASIIQAFPLGEWAAVSRQGVVDLSHMKCPADRLQGELVLMEAHVLTGRTQAFWLGGLRRPRGTAVPIVEGLVGFRGFPALASLFSFCRLSSDLGCLVRS